MQVNTGTDQRNKVRLHNVDQGGARETNGLHPERWQSIVLDDRDLI